MFKVLYGGKRWTIISHSERAPTDSIRRIEGKLSSPLAVDGEERRPKRVTTRGSFKWSVPLLSSSLHPPLLHYHSFNRLICALWGEGCPVMQKWRRVIPHSCHNLVAHCGGMRPLGAFTDTAQAARANVFFNFSLSYRHSFAVLDKWCWTEARSYGLTLRGHSGQKDKWAAGHVTHQTNTSLAYNKNINKAIQRIFLSISQTRSLGVLENTYKELGHRRIFTLIHQLGLLTGSLFV